MCSQGADHWIKISITDDITEAFGIFYDTVNNVFGTQSLFGGGAIDSTASQFLGNFTGLDYYRVTVTGHVGQTGTPIIVRISQTNADNTTNATSGADFAWWAVGT